jgi:hypothetical protein
MPTQDALNQDPRSIYSHGLTVQQGLLGRIRRWISYLVGVRLLGFVGALALTYEACSHHGVSWLWPALSGLLFLSLTVAIVLVENLAARHEGLVRYFEEGLARLEGQRTAGRPDGMRFCDPSHPYAVDLDIFGTSSLFNLLCAARTGTGQATLAHWLTRPAPIHDVTLRQQAVRELATLVSLRQDLWLAGGVVCKEVREDALEAWLASPATRVALFKRLSTGLLGALGIVVLIAFAEPSLILPAVLIVLVQRFFARRHRPLVLKTQASISRRADELRTVARVIGRLQRETFTAPLLTTLRATLASEDLPANRRISQLVRLIDWLESRRNPFFGLFAAILLLPEQLCFAIESWRAKHGPAAARWMAVIGEIEALCSIATFAFERPDCPFPELSEQSATPIFSAVALKHPLIPGKTCVPNDVRLDVSSRLLVVTGSNMSGKSTLLRTVGTNAVMAFAGAPVCAEQMSISSLKVAASLRAQDSLENGISRFFAEIKRLHAILTMATEPPPVLFLLDEILNGTNSVDRREGAEAVISQLLELGAIGIVTTHDLALVDLANKMKVPCLNVHFQDSLEGDRMLFDYRMRPGPVSRRNALLLMRLVGIKVPPSQHPEPASKELSTDVPDHKDD